MDRIGKLKELLDTQPDDSFLQHALALEYIKLGDDIAARALFERVLANEPGYVGTYYHLAKLLERMGEPASAMEVYEAGLKQAKLAGDNHAYNELRGAFDDLSDY